MKHMQQTKPLNRTGEITLAKATPGVVKIWKTLEVGHLLIEERIRRDKPFRITQAFHVHHPNEGKVYIACCALNSYITIDNNGEYQISSKSQQVHGSGCRMPNGSQTFAYYWNYHCHGVITSKSTISRLGYPVDMIKNSVCNPALNSILNIPGLIIPHIEMTCYTCGYVLSNCQCNNYEESICPGCEMPTDECECDEDDY